MPEPPALGPSSQISSKKSEHSQSFFTIKFSTDIWQFNHIFLIIPFDFRQYASYIILQFLLACAGTGSIALVLDVELGQVPETIRQIWQVQI